MLIPFGQEIWITDGRIVEVFGFHYPTRMAVIRLADGGLFIWSPTALNDDLRAQIDVLGAVAHIVAPNSLHHLSIPDWHQAYPNAKLYCAPKLREKRADIPFDQDLGDTPNSGWLGEIDQVVFAGNKITSEVVFFHPKSGTVLFTDILQQFPQDWFRGWRKIVARLDRMVGPEPSVPHKFRLAFTNRAAARASLKRILAWPAQNVLMAHGTPVTKDAKAFLARAFGWLSV